jgi:hypothetical protein
MMFPYSSSRIILYIHGPPQCIHNYLHLFTRGFLIHFSFVPHRHLRVLVFPPALHKREPTSQCCVRFFYFFYVH